MAQELSHAVSTQVHMARRRVQSALAGASERLGLELTGNRAQAHETLYETNLYQRLAPAFTRAPRGEPRAGCTLPQHQP